MRHRPKASWYLTPAILAFVILFSVFVYVAQNIESRTTVILAPALTVAPVAPTVSASQFVVFDMNTGVVILSRDVETVVSIASITKLFAAANLLTNYNVQATTAVTWSDLAGVGGAGKLAYGQTYTYRELLFPLLIESSNDAALVLERTTAGALVTDMNEWASTTGATKTTFTDTSGIADANVSTASDLQLLLRNAFSNHPHIFDITTLPQYIGLYTGWLNNNPVALEPGYRGGKNGYTITANRTLVAVFDEKINGHEYMLGYIVLGSNDIKADFSILRQFINNSAT